MAALSITAANVARVAGDVGFGTAGASLTAGLLLYADSTDLDSNGNPKLKGADADALASSLVVGIALHAAGSGQPITYLKPSETAEINIGATVTVGVPYFCGISVAGDIVPLADLGTGDYMTYIGMGKTASNILFRVHNTQVVKA